MFKVTNKKITNSNEETIKCALFGNASIRFEIPKYQRAYIAARLNDAEKRLPECWSIELMEEWRDGTTRHPCRREFARKIANCLQTLLEEAEVVNGKL